MDRTDASSPARAATLVAVMATAVTLPFGQAVTGVQLDSIGAALPGSTAALQWVANGYNLAFSALLLIAGSLADITGRRRVFVAGTAVFLAGSLASAAAPGLLSLDAFRLVAGAGAAAQLASAPALLASAFPEPGPGRARAFGLLGTGFGVGLALGPVVGGLLVAGTGWRWAFLIVVPFAAAGLLAAYAIPEVRDPAPRRFDRLGAATFAAALTLLMLALGRGTDRGWADPAALGLAVAAVVAGAAWARVEARRDAPLFDLRVLAEPAFLGASVAWWAAAFGFVALLIFVPFHLQSARGATAFAAGLALLPMTVPLLLVPSVAPWLAARLGPARLVPTGVLLIAAGDAVIAGTGPGGTWPWLPLGLLLVGAGAGSINGLLDNIAMSAIPAERAGMAAGGFQTMRVSGDAVAIAVAGSVLVPLTMSRVAGALASVDPQNAVRLAGAAARGSVPADGLSPVVQAALLAGTSSAFRSLMLVLAAVTACGALAAWRLLRDRT